MNDLDLVRQLTEDGRATLRRSFHEAENRSPGRGGDNLLGLLSLIEGCDFRTSALRSVVAHVLFIGRLDVIGTDARERLEGTAEVARDAEAPAETTALGVRGGAHNVARRHEGRVYAHVEGLRVEDVDRREGRDAVVDVDVADGAHLLAGVGMGRGVESGLRRERLDLHGACGGRHGDDGGDGARPASGRGHGLASALLKHHAVEGGEGPVASSVPSLSRAANFSRTRGDAEDRGGKASPEAAVVDLDVRRGFNLVGGLLRGR